MPITRQNVADQLAAYLRHELTLSALVVGPSNKSSTPISSPPAVRDAVARLGLADVRAFGLTWEDCERLLHDLGYSARIDIVAA